MNDQSISFSPKQIDTLIQSEKLFILYVHCVIVTVKGPGTRPMPLCDKFRARKKYFIE